jgi:hypothetical protein
LTRTILQVRRRKLAEDEERAKRRERLQKLQTKWIQAHETVRSFLLFKAIFENIEMLRQRDWRQNQAALTITKFFALITFLSRSQKLLQVKRILRRSMWIPLMNIRIHRKKKSCHLIARLFDVMHARRYGVYAVMLYRARILKVQRFLQRCIASFKAQVGVPHARRCNFPSQSHEQVAMNVVAAAAFVDVSDRVQDIIKRRVQKKGAGSKSKEHAKGQKDSKKAVSLSHLQSTIADTMSNEAFQQCICKVVREQVSRLRVEHFRRFRDYLRAMKRSAFRGAGSGNMLESEAQQKVMVRIRRAVLEELSSRQYATLARAMKVHRSLLVVVHTCTEAVLPGFYIATGFIHATSAHHSSASGSQGTPHHCTFDSVQRFDLHAGVHCDGNPGLTCLDAQCTNSQSS